MLSLLPAAGLLLALALLLSIYHQLGRLPARAADLARRERERTEREASDALQEATALKVGRLVTSLRSYEEQMAADFRAQIAAAETRARMAETRARVAEREASEAASVLSVASELLRDVRATHDSLGELSAIVATRTSPAPPPEPEPEADPEEIRRTIEIPPPPPPREDAANDDEPEEELTQVATRPASGMQPAARGPR